MQKACANTWCKQSFEITDEDLAFYDKVSPIFSEKKHAIPPPKLCPTCRQQRRLVFRNERSLYQRKSDLSGKRMIAMYDQKSTYKVYDQEEWWSDEWDGMDYGSAFDFSKPFFAQFAKLSQNVPRIALLNVKAENSPYCNFADVSKNCHLVITSNFNENCLYCTILLNSRSCSDCLWTVACELCYECTDVEQCYRVRFSHESQNCSDSLFLYDCKGCSECIGCVNLRQKKLHILNRPVTKKEYDTKLKELESKEGIDRFQREFEAFRLTQPHQYRRVLQSENVRGDHLTRCKNLEWCFDGFDTEDCRYIDTVARSKNCIDSVCIDGAELSIESVSLIGFHNCYTAFCRNSSDLFYSWDCHSCENLFGCIGLKRKKYCVFNKQYTKDQYEELVPRLIAHMRSTEEWGEFFPISLSPFAYNETIAQEHFPLEKHQIVKSGCRWQNLTDETPNVANTVDASALPDSISDVDDNVTKKVIQCEATGRLFKIIRQELKLYRELRIPLPHLHSEERHRRRMALRNPRRLWERKCGKCDKGIQTTYAPDRPEIVYCESCYLASVY